MYYVHYISVVKGLWSANGECHGRRIQEALNFDLSMLVCRAAAAAAQTENGTGRVFSGGISALAVLPEDGII